MHWADSIAKALSHRGNDHVIASGITPSGEFHIGHLREILTSDIIKRACLHQNPDANIQFVFFVDDADPLRKVYSFLDNSYEQFIGHQLAKIPPPDKNGAPDFERFNNGKGMSYADYFLEPFKQALEILGVEIDEYISNYQAYKTGKFTDQARAACNQADQIREIIERVSGRELDEDWFPWNPIDAEGCMDGITVTGWEDPIVHWKDSNGNTGQSDVTKGEGKLPWRIDWPAKWAWRKVTMEPFGKDHGAAGGSYDTGKEIVGLFDALPPYPTTYEWISLKGAGAMSSSTGVTIGPLESLRLVPPEIMRYLIARSQPKRHIDFDTGNALIELADEYQRKMSNVHILPEPGASKRQIKAHEVGLSQLVYSAVSSELGWAVKKFVSEVGQENLETSQQLKIAFENLTKVSFRHLALIAQLRENDADVWESLLRSGLIIDSQYHDYTEGMIVPDDIVNPDLSDNSRINLIVQSHVEAWNNLPLRLELMRNWINSPHFPEGFRLRIQDEISDGAKENIDSRDLQYFIELQQALSSCEWESGTINNHVCELAKQKSMSLRDTFELLYWIFLDQNFGPKLANILAEMSRDDVLNLLQMAIDELSS